MKDLELFRIDLESAPKITDAQLKNAKPFDCGFVEESELESTPLIRHAQKTTDTQLITEPFSSVGKLYSIVYENLDDPLSLNIAVSKGSAFVIGPNLLMTAAHCIYGTLVLNKDNNQRTGYFKRFEYRPLFPLSTEPIRIKEAWVPAEYIANINSTNKRIPYDYGFLVTETAIPGIALNLGLSEAVHENVKAIGYPEVFPFLGLQYYCEGKCEKNTQQRAMVMNPNDMRPGCSGGPWISDGKVIGLNSHTSFKRRKTGDEPYQNIFEFESPIISQAVIDKANSLQTRLINSAVV